MSVLFFLPQTVQAHIWKDYSIFHLLLYVSVVPYKVFSSKTKQKQVLAKFVVNVYNMLHMTCHKSNTGDTIPCYDLLMIMRSACAPCLPQQEYLKCSLHGIFSVSTIHTL